MDNNFYEKNQNGRQAEPFAPSSADNGEGTASIQESMSGPRQQASSPLGEHQPPYEPPRSYEAPPYRSNPYGNGYTPNTYGQTEGRPSYGNPYSPHNGYPQGGGYREFGRTGQSSPYQGGNGYATPQPSPVYYPPVKDTKAASRGFVVGMVCLGMVLCLLIGGLGGVALFNALSNGSRPLGDGSVVIQQGSQEDKPPVTDRGSAAYVASIASDTVVEITTETVTTDRYYGQYVTQGAGSGVIISSGDNGSYIITCAHVIEGATKIIVKLTNGDEYEATFAASDTQTDIGVLRIDVTGLKYASVADFSQVVVGEEVVAIGNPLGELGGSVTNGIVSALDRDVIIDGTIYHLLQTNTEINPGNSGGGLFNMDGELIGVVNAKSAGENIEGLGFAIPVNVALEIATELIEHGYVTGRVKIGIEVLSLLTDADVQKNWQYSRFFTGYGLYIINAEDERLKTGDRVVAVDSFEITDTIDLKTILLEYEVGDVITLTVSRISPATNRPEMIDVEITLTEKTA